MHINIRYRVHNNSDDLIKSEKIKIFESMKKTLRIWRFIFLDMLL